MSLLQSILLGIIEGLTEFLPVSSTFHLILFSKVLGLAQTPFVKSFEIVIQSGAILAVFALYTKELLTNFRLQRLLVYSFFPTALAGYLLYSFIKGILFENLLVMVGMFILVGFLFLWVEKLVANNQLKLTHSTDSMSVAHALIIGLAQALAVIPGVSRSGSVIISMMLLGYERSASARYSFLLAVPTILGASVLDIYQSKALWLNLGENITPALLGFLTSFIVAYLIIRWFVRYLELHSLAIFGYYRLAFFPLFVYFLVN